MEEAANRMKEAIERREKCIYISECILWTGLRIGFAVIRVHSVMMRKNVELLCRGEKGHDVVKRNVGKC